jgi:hypothetical protein
LEGSYFFFDALPADIESNRVLINIRSNNFKVYDETTDSDVDFNIDSRGFIRRSRRIIIGIRFPFYHDVNNFDLSIFQIFSLDQLNSNERLSIEHCFANCLRYF